MNKFIFLIFSFLLLAGFLAGSFALAQDSDTQLHFNPAESDEELGNAEEVQLGRSGPATIAGNIINVALGLLGLTFLVLTIYGGFLWMSARGNEEQVTKAKNVLKTAVIGLVIVLASYAIAQFVYYQLVGSTIEITGQGD